MSKRLVLPRPGKEMNGPNPPFTHSNYDILDECSCFLCRDLANQTDVVKKLERASPVHEVICVCPTCKSIRKERALMTAYAIRRDTFSELSFLTANKTWRKEFLTWFIAILYEPLPQSYWANVVDGITLGYWIQRWAEETGRIK